MAAFRRGQPRRGEESPGSTETRCRVTPGGGDPRESATESKPPGSGRVRVKGCGKSAPRGRQRSWHGKPHREQDRIGAGRPVGNHGPTGVSACRPGWSREAAGNRRPRGMAILRPASPQAFGPGRDTGPETEPGLQAICCFLPKRSTGPGAGRRSELGLLCLKMRTKEKQTPDRSRNKHSILAFVPSGRAESEQERHKSHGFQKIQCFPMTRPGHPIAFHRYP